MGIFFLYCSKQSTIAKEEEEEVVIARLSSSQHKQEGKDFGICKRNLTRHA